LEGSMEKNDEVISMSIERDGHVYVSLEFIGRILRNAICVCHAVRSVKVLSAHDLWDIYSKICETVGVENDVSEPPNVRLMGSGWPDAFGWYGFCKWWEEV